MTESTESGERHSAAPGLTGWTATILAGITAAFLAFLGNIIVTYLEGRNALQLKREEFQTSLILKAIKTGDAEVAAKNLSFFIQAGFLDDKDGKISSFLQSRQNVPVLPPSGKLQKRVYESVQIQGFTTDKISYSQGENVNIYYELVNRSNETLVVPENRDYSQPFHLLGTIQHWIQRLGPDSTIPSIPARIVKKGARYGAGGTIVPISAEFRPLQRIPIQRAIDTKGYPIGRYRFYAEYKELAGQVIETATVDFVIE